MNVLLARVVPRYDIRNIIVIGLGLSRVSLLSALKMSN